MGIRNVHFRFGDGTLGWPEEAPFDRILITAGAPRAAAGIAAGPVEGWRHCRAARRAGGRADAGRGPPRRAIDAQDHRRLPLPVCEADRKEGWDERRNDNCGRMSDLRASDRTRRAEAAGAAIQLTASPAILRMTRMSRVRNSLTVSARSPVETLAGVGPPAQAFEPGRQHAGRSARIFPARLPVRIVRAADRPARGRPDPDRARHGRAPSITSPLGRGRALKRRSTTAPTSSRLVWFNGPTSAARIHPGMNIRVQGKVRFFRNFPQMANPHWEVVDADTARDRRIQIPPDLSGEPAAAVGDDRADHRRESRRGAGRRCTNGSSRRCSNSAACSAGARRIARSTAPPTCARRCGPAADHLRRADADAAWPGHQQAAARGPPHRAGHAARQAAGSAHPQAVSVRADRRPAERRLGDRPRPAAAAGR